MPSLIQRDSTLDILKFCLAFFIVCIHFHLFENNNYICYVFHSGICRIAVPIFFIINGFYFSCDTTYGLLKWVKRVFILYLIWMLIYSYFWAFPDPFSDIIWLIKKFLIGYYHLWYVSAMIGAGVLTYFFRKNKLIGLCAFIILGIVGLVLQYYSGYVNSLNIPYFRNFLFFGFPFFFVGYYLKSSQLMKISKTWNIVVIIIGTILLFIETFINYKFNAENIEILASTYLLCPAIFICCYNSGYKSNTKNIALLSSAIFFTHKLLGDMYHNFMGYTSISIDSCVTFDTVIIFLLCVLISLCIIRINERLKYIL